MHVIRHPQEITENWLTQALRSTGAIDSAVSRVEPQVIGKGVGLMAQLARLTIAYEEPESAPTSMIAKFAAANENKAVAQVLDFYNRETNFYNRIGSQCPMRVPDSYFGLVDQSSYDFILLMEDLGDVSPNDQITGASEEEAYSAIEAVARMHVKWWGGVRTPDCAWMYDVMSTDSAKLAQDLVYGPALAPALEKFEPHFDDVTRDLCRKVGADYPAYWGGRLTQVETFIHGDYRQDNLLYPGDGQEAIVMDWQISGIGKPIFDFTYFVCQSLPAALRKRIEKPLLEFYIAKLKEGGITNYSVEQAWHDYRIMVLGCLIYPITVCGSLDLSNERGKALATCMLERNLLAIDELDCAELIL